MWLREEDGGRKGAFGANDPVPAENDGGTSELAGSGARAKAVCELALQGEHHAFDGENGVREVEDDLTGDVVRKITDDGQRAIWKEVPDVTSGGVAVDDLELRVTSGEVVDQPVIFLHESAFLTPLHGEVGECAESGADLHPRRVGFDLSKVDDCAGEVLVVEKVLSEAFGRACAEFCEQGLDLGEGHGEGSFSAGVAREEGLECVDGGQFSEEDGFDATDDRRVEAAVLCEFGDAEGCWDAFGDHLHGGGDFRK